MAFFDDLKKTVSDTTQGAKNLAEVTKLNVKINDLTKKNSGVYEEIGKIYYEKTKAAPEAEYLELYGQLEENAKAIEELQAQIREIKGVVTCPNCGSDVKAGQNFCSQCGAQVIVDEEATEPVKFCSACGEPVAAAAATCPKCGESL